MQSQPVTPPNRNLAARAGLLVGLLAFFGLVVSDAPLGISDAGWGVAALAALMMIWWMTEAIPLAATALAPIVFLPLLGVSSLETVARSYAHPLIFLFLGGFLIAKALVRWKLHERIAFRVVRLGNQGPAGLIASIMAVTAFLSMWISNTATAMVMVPIAQAIIVSLRNKKGASVETGSFAAALMLGIAFSATIGCMATLIGTPPNALLAGYLKTAHGVSIGFADWMLLGIPIVIVLLPTTWLLLTRLVFRLPSHADMEIAEFVSSIEPAEAGLPVGAKLTAGIVIISGLALVLHPFAKPFLPGLPLSDAGIVVTAALCLMATPAFASDGSKLLAWEDAKSIRWDVLILFGGGLALASAIETSGLSLAIGSSLSGLKGVPVAVVIFIVMACMVLLGELASNTAMAAVFLPVASAVALGLGSAPLEIILPVGLAASLGFMLPVATPPNAIVYGSGEVTSSQMLRAGAILDVLAVIVVYGLAVTVGPWVFQNLLTPGQM